MLIGNCRRVVTVLAVVAATVGVASAQTVITQTATFGPVTTDSGTTATFEDFESLAPVGAVLQSVSLELSISEYVSSLSFTDQNGIGDGDTVIPAATQDFSYYTTAAFSVFGSAPDLASLTTGLTTGPVVLYSIGDPNGDPITFDTEAQTINPFEDLYYLGPGTTTGTIDPTLIGNYAANNSNGLGGYTNVTPYTFSNSIAGTTSAYVNSGPFTIGYDTSTAQYIFGSGGNVFFSQGTYTDATMEVDYTYTSPTPEPSTFVLIGAGFLGVALFKRSTSQV